jgi:thiol peroxidase
VGTRVKILNRTEEGTVLWYKVLLPDQQAVAHINPGKENKMDQRKGIATMKGNAVTLVGSEVKVGDTAPDFIVVDNNLSPVNFSSYRGKICIISSVPSLDTPVCDLETKTFNEKAVELGPDITILTVSMDLPFAQKRWCAAAWVEQVQTFLQQLLGHFCRKIDISS